MTDSVSSPDKKPDKEPSSEGSNSENANKTPPRYDPKPRKPSPGATGEDAADNPAYDQAKSNQRDLDREILLKHIISKWMTIIAAGVLLFFTVCFFVYTIIFAHGFLNILSDHIHAYNKIQGEKSIIPFLMPFMPATLFAALGVATMVTAMRFVNAYVNALDERNDGIFIIEKIISEIAKAAKNFKSGGSD